MVTPSQRRACAQHVIEKGMSSERRACRLAKVPRSSMGYRPQPNPERERLKKRIRTLASRHKRYGYRRIRALLERKGERISKGKMERLWKREGLALPRRRPKRRRHGHSGRVVQQATHKNHVWTYDFLEDRTVRGGRLRILVVLDEYTRECLAIHVAPSITSRQVIHVLEWLFLTRGVPAHIRSDNGPELVARALQDWLKKSDCKTLYITPGSPWENPYIESFNGHFRDECLNCEIFRNGQEARQVVEAWREEYNERRPHSSLGYRTPAEFAAQSVDRAGLMTNASRCSRPLGELLRSSPHAPQPQIKPQNPIISLGPKK